MSVRPSLWYSVVMVIHILKLFPLSGKPHHSTFSVPNGMAIFRRRPPNGGVERKGEWKNSDFRPTSRFISEMIQDRATHNGRPIEGRMVYQTALFSMTMNNPNPAFKVAPFFDAEYDIRETVRDWQLQWHTNRGIICPSQECYFERPFWLT